ncbi:MAG TPA: hypothetical protein VJR89_00460 [Polyangiales bacterium]|nr:hypothetical protein [Polyangiales bacterium]
MPRTWLTIGVVVCAALIACGDDEGSDEQDGGAAGHSGRGGARAAGVGAGGKGGVGGRPYTSGDGGSFGRDAGAGVSGQEAMSCAGGRVGFLPPVAGKDPGDSGMVPEVMLDTDGSYDCMPTHYRGASCTVVGLNEPWVLELDGVRAEVVSHFECAGEWKAGCYTPDGPAPKFECRYSGLNAPTPTCIMRITKLASGVLRVALDSSGTTADCTRRDEP